MTDIKITADGQAAITLKIKDDYAPLREGTRAAIRQFSLSGIANRYVDLHCRPTAPPRSPTAAGSASTAPARRSTSTSSSTRSTPPTRKGLQGFFKGQARQFADGAGRQRAPSST